MSQEKEIELFAEEEAEVSEHSNLIQTLQIAVENNDYETLNIKVDEWLEIMEQDIARAVWQDLYLSNPLVMAVRREKKQVVHYLVYKKFLRLKKPCRKNCSCYLCQTLREDMRFHQLYTSRVLSSLISWTYIVVAHTTEPIHSCLKIWKAIRRSGLYDGYSQEGMYETLRSEIDSTIARCLDCTINEDEVHVLVCNKKQKWGDEVESLKKVALITNADMKKATAHPAIQSLTMTHWLKDAHLLFGHDFQDSAKIPFIARMVVNMFVYLIIVPVSIVFPHPKILRFLKAPTTVYSNEAISYWVFLVVVTATFFFKEQNVYYIICKPRVQYYHYIVSFFILSRFIRTCDGILRLGLKYFISPYEIMQSLSTCLYVSGMTMLLIAVTIVPTKEQAYKACLNLAYNLSSDSNITQQAALQQLLDKPVTQCQSVKAFYQLDPLYANFINDAIMPHNLAALFFAVGHLFYYLSAGNVLYMNRLVCHLNIAVTRMFIDVFKWGMLMLLFYFAWGLAMVSLYANYTCENTIFSNVRSAMFEMFWVLFALTGTTDYELNGPLTTYDHVGTNLIQYTGFTLYASYYIVAEIVLVNLLIALMSVTFQKIEDGRVQEMTYWRTKIQLKYVFWHDRSAIPSPFNVFFPIFLLTRYCWRHRCMTRKTPVHHDELASRQSEETLFQNRNKIIKELLNRRH